MENPIPYPIPQTTNSTLKYILLQGRVQLGYISDPQSLTETDPAAAKPGPALVLTPLDDKFEPISALKPIYVYLHKDEVVKVLDINLIAEFNKEGFDQNIATIRHLNPGIGDWDTLQASTDSPEMNPSGPPKSRG
ncbi:hypothetical protein ACO2Q8_18940 [Larkinella sp. VNQ87]|uniref:hypothetical protein n=1 Tax=Larkinella sp. VNQ87 TaxID=3400921 RepID=UPI003C07B246